MVSNNELEVQALKDNDTYTSKSLEEQLADAQKEIADLKSQIMWMNRSYE